MVRSVHKVARYTNIYMWNNAKNGHRIISGNPLGLEMADSSAFTVGCEV